MVEKFNSEITLESIRSGFPQESETALQLLYQYMNLRKIAIRLNMLSTGQFNELEALNSSASSTFERLHLRAAAVLRLIKDEVYKIQVPSEKEAFQHWVENSAEYPVVVCHDGFFDIFISAQKELHKD